MTVALDGENICEFSHFFTFFYITLEIASEVYLCNFRSFRLAEPRLCRRVGRSAKLKERMSYEKDKLLHRTHGKAEPAVVVVGRIHSTAIEVQVVGVRRIAERTTPVEAERAPAIQGRTIAVARGREE